MARPLRVLILDDSVYNCMLLVKELRRAGFEPRYTRVDVPETLRTELDRQAWDVVISAYTMPKLSALAAIKVVREHQPNLPFIVLAETTGDEAAVTALTAGARDYVVKDKLERLFAALERILQEGATPQPGRAAVLTRADQPGQTPPEIAGPRGAEARAMQRVGRYRVLEKLGEGGMGTVYKAHDPKLDRLVAVKVPRFDAGKWDLALVVQRFLREARVAARIRHPNVCPIYDADEENGVPFVVMAYVEGQSLAEHLSDIHRYEDLEEAVALIRQAALGLKEVHAHGIVHRDLKPANILLDRAGQPLLTDFGLARPEQDSQPLTLHGAVLGTPGFMAPEQAAGEQELIGPWTDLCSLSIVLYCMLTGRPPFQGSAQSVLHKVLHDSPPDPSTLRPGLDHALEAIILKGMARRPVDRYQSAEEFIAALDQWLLAQRSLPQTTDFPTPGKS